MLVEGNYEISDSIYELNLDPHYNSLLRWTELPQKLKVPRQFVAAVILPAELDACQQVSSPKGTLMVVGGTGDTESIKFASDFSLVNYFFYTYQKNSNEVDIKSVTAFALKPCYIVLTLKRLICVPIFHSFFKQVQKIAINYTPISPCSDVFFKSHLHKIWNLESLLLKIYGLLVQPRHFEVVFIEIISRRKRK